MEGLYSIGRFASKIGVTTQTLRNWHADGSLVPVKILDSGARYYSEEQYMDYMGKCSSKKKKVVGYCRVDGIEKDYTSELSNKAEKLRSYMDARKYDYELIKDIGARNDLSRYGLWELVKDVSMNSVSKVVVLNKSDLLGIGTEIIEKILELHNVKLEVLSTEDIEDTKESTVFQITKATGELLTLLNKDIENQKEVDKIVKAVMSLAGKGDVTG